MTSPVRFLRFMTCLAGLLVGLAAAEPAIAPVPEPPETWLTQPGPWGVLRCTRIRLRPPQEILDRTRLPDAGTWSFDGLDWDGIDAWLDNVPLTPAERAALADPRLRSGGTDGTPRTIRVPSEIRRGFSRAARTRLYDGLAAFESNLLQALPFVLRSTAAIDRANLNPALRAALDELSFPRGRRRCLVDADLLSALAADDAELQRLKRLLFTVHSVSVELDRASLANRQEVAAYWAAPQGKTAAGFLRVFDRSPQLSSVDLAHLLPPLPQRVLNSYPGSVDSPADANWLAFNFFNPRPDPRYLAGAGRHLRREDEEWHTLAQSYEPVGPPYRFGDLLGLFAETGPEAELVHMMVYLADDLVLTKNGAAETNPFVLMRLDDIEQAYAWVTTLAIRGFRLKQPPVSGDPAAR